MDILKTKSKQMENIVLNAFEELKARENLLLQIFNELGNLPFVFNNGQNISNILGAQVRQLDERKIPCVKIEVLWKEQFYDKLYICLNVKNDTEFSGKVNCSLNGDKHVLSKLKYFIVDHFVECDNVIRSNCSGKVVTALDIDAFQNKNQSCILIVDWLFIPLQNSEKSILSANFLTQFQRETTEMYKPLHFTFTISFSKNDSMQLFSTQYFETALEKDAVKGLYALFLSKNFCIFKHSVVNLQTIFIDFNQEKLFDTIDFGKWQLFLGKETSVWARIIIYIPADNIEMFLPNYSVLFASTKNELDNFNSFINYKILELENSNNTYCK